MVEFSTIVYSTVAVIGALAGFAFAAAYTYYLHPELVIKGTMRYMLLKLGFSKKYVRIGNILYCYAEKGKSDLSRSSIVFVHGFSASKDMWVPTIKYMSNDYHYIIIDLAGHGDSTIPGSEFDVSLDSMTADLHRIIEHIGVNKFHLVGISLGGAISQNYCLKHPENVSLVSLICPAMRTPEETDFQREVSEGRCMLIVDNIDDLRSLFERIASTDLKLNNTILKGLLRMRLPRNDFLQRVFGEIRRLDSTKEGRDFEEKAAEIDIPAQVIWGQDDQLVHVSGANLLGSRLLDCRRVDIFDGCGHSCNLDQPRKLGQVLTSFHDDVSSGSKKSD